METNEKEYPLIDTDSIQIVDYWKFVFTINVKTIKGSLIQVVIGGEPDAIYRLDPFGGWDEWIAAGINSVRTLTGESEIDHLL